MKLIEAFIAGVLPLPQGTTLRSYLSEKLSCDPMRITKKFAGSNGIGKQVFSPCMVSERSNEVKSTLLTEIEELERIFHHKVEHKQNASFPVSAKALAFSAKLQMQVQHAPLLTNDFVTSKMNSNRHLSTANNSNTTSIPWASRFDASNTNSITVNGSTTEYNPGEKRALASSDHSHAGATDSRKRVNTSSDLDASSLLLNFFKATRDKDSSDVDSDSNDSSNSITSNKHSGGSGSSTLEQLNYDSSGFTTTSDSSSGSDDLEEHRKNAKSLPF